jgi:1A family penicillin-binding protein
MYRFNTVSWTELITRVRAAVTRKRLIIAGIVLLAFLILTPIITYAYFAHDISNRERLMNRNNTGIIIRDRKSKIIYEYGTINNNNDVPLSKISDDVEHAIIASEDAEFYHHPGFSIRGIARALFADAKHKSATAYGGSTITQQLVKNKLLSSDKNYLRKYQEVAMAVAVERRYTKDEILDMYLNSVYFGEGAFGINEAAKVYFNKTPAQLDLAESSMLIGLLPAPSAYSPLSGDSSLAKEQQQVVLSRMARDHYITKSQKEQAINQGLVYAKRAADKQNYAPHFTQMIIAQLKKKYGEEKYTRSGYDVTTGLDLSWQKQAEAIIKQQVAVSSSLGGRNACLVAEDPKTGEVRALVASVDWNNKDFGQVNMTTTLRQPGSSFKPIYFSKAFEKKLITAATILDDSKKTFGNSYTPRDYDNRYKGKMPVRSALAESRNVPAVEVMQKLGVANGVQAAQEMGLSSVDGNPSHYGLSLALGTAEIRLTDMVNAYSAFANKGQLPEQTLITQIKDKYGRTVYRHKVSHKQVRSPGAAFIIDSILSDKTARAPTYGSRLNIPGRPVAFKTGTTNDNRDGWTIGFTPNLVVGAWMGNNENEPMIGLAGGSSAGIIWKHAMTTFLEDLPVEKFEKPKSVVQLNICRGTELRAPYSGGNTFMEYFIKGSEPKATCNTQKKSQQPQPKKEEQQPQEQKKPTNTGDTNTTNAGSGSGTTKPSCTTNPDGTVTCVTSSCTTNPDGTNTCGTDCTDNGDGTTTCQTTGSGSGTGGGGGPTTP